MKKPYTHLSLEEREKLYMLKEQGFSFREIGKKLTRYHKTLAREYRRNRRAGCEYVPCKAHEKSQQRAERQRQKAPLKNPEVYLYVREKLRLRWSPETIAGRIRIDLPHQKICHETIYQYIFEKGRKEELSQYLVRRRKKRRKQDGRCARKMMRHSRIPGAISIENRAWKVYARRQVGHFETDLMEGVRSEKIVLSVEVERKTRYTQLTLLPSKHASIKEKILTKKLKTLQSLSMSHKPIVRSVTSDNGTENTNHAAVSAAIDVSMYFCHPYASWEKGTVENTVGRVRRFIPKGTSLSPYTNTYIQRLENKLNSTPRKCLAYLTPDEAMEREVNSYKFRRFKSLQWGTSN